MTLSIVCFFLQWEMRSAWKLVHISDGTMSDGMSDSGVEAEADSGELQGAYVLALDVGTTTLRAHVYDAKAAIMGTGTEKVWYIVVFKLMPCLEVFEVH